MVLEELVELENVGVVHRLENADLRLQFVFFVFFKILFIDYLDGTQCLGLFM